jgi:hypothetical protein
MVSGDALYIFDPLRRMFIEPSDDDKKPNSIGAAGRAYVFPGTDIGKRFPHQFQPFTDLPFKFVPTLPFPGTIIRLPLRSESSSISGVTYSMQVSFILFFLYDNHSSLQIFCFTVYDACIAAFSAAAARAVDFPHINSKLHDVGARSWCAGPATPVHHFHHQPQGS